MVFKKRQRDFEKKSIDEILKEEMDSLSREERQVMKFLRKKNKVPPMIVRDL